MLSIFINYPSIIIKYGLSIKFEFFSGIINDADRMSTNAKTQFETHFKNLMKLTMYVDELGMLADAMPQQPLNNKTFTAQDIPKEWVIRLADVSSRMKLLGIDDNGINVTIAKFHATIKRKLGMK
jgi:hypothetical protein